MSFISMQIGSRLESLDLLAMVARLGARDRIRTDDLPITSRSQTVRLMLLRRIVAAQVKGVVQQVIGRTIGCERLGCQSGCHHVGTVLLASQEGGRHQMTNGAA